MRRVVLAVVVLALACPTGRGGAVEKRAIDDAVARGVKALIAAQRHDGSYHNSHMGAAALAGLTLLECGEAADSRAVSAAAGHVRKAALKENQTYSAALAVLFLDRLGEPTDTPLIESLIVRLVAGQRGDGMWSYDCPSVSDEEVKRIKGEMDGSRVLRAGGDLKKLPAPGKRTSKDLPESVRERLATIAKVGGAALPRRPGVEGLKDRGDNSNTQFAIIALWAGRRYGIPTQPTLVKAYNHFRITQHRDGGWAYSHSTAIAVPGVVTPHQRPTATMTCAGVLGLAVGHGANLEIKQAKGSKADSADVTRDDHLKAGLVALGASVGAPLGWDGVARRPAAVPSLGGRGYYYLWSLERICVALGLRTVGKKDWYNWGAEIILANQAADGHWKGEYASFHADTCFALLFLVKANLTHDLKSKVRGLRDPGERLLKGGGGLDGPRVPEKLPDTGVGEKAPPKDKPVVKPERPAEKNAARELASRLPGSEGRARAEIIEKLRDTRGVTYTEALAEAIPSLEGEAKKEARQALTLRLSRMKDGTLADYLVDDDAEIRRAAALACGTKGTKAHLGRLVKMLSDGNAQVRKAAHAALKELTGKAFGPEPAGWEKWWKETGRE